jgi:hypothetical protein
MEINKEDSTMQAKLIHADNGYFEIWERPNGVQVRVNTEDQQLSLRRPGARARFHQVTRERLSS